MELINEKEYYLRTSDFDCRGKIKISSILDLFQDIAGDHAQKIGIGMETMLEKKLIWVLSKLKLQIFGDVGLYSRVKARTWPLPPTRIGFIREYLIMDDDGNILIKGTSEWVVVNSETRRFARAMDIFPSDWEYITVKNFPDRLGRGKDFDAEGEPYTVLPAFSDTDVNGHVSNIRYADYVLDALDLKDDEFIDTFRLDFHREVQRGDELRIYTRTQDGIILAKGTGHAGELMFSCEITLK